MHINLILGALVLAAIFWLVRGYRRSRRAPGRMLDEELARRRKIKEERARALAKLDALRRERLAPLLEALDGMGQTLATGGHPDLLSFSEADGKIQLSLAPPPGGPREPLSLTITWADQHLDLQALQGKSGLDIAGEYVLSYPEGQVRHFADLQSLLSALSVIIADFAV